MPSFHLLTRLHGHYQNKQKGEKHHPPLGFRVNKSDFSVLLLSKAVVVDSHPEGTPTHSICTELA